MSQQPVVGIVGVGAMGMGVARALLRAGYRVQARDLRTEAEDEARAAGAFIADSPAALAGACEVVITLVVDAAQTQSVMFGADGLHAACSRNQTVLMCSTIAPDDAAGLSARWARQGIAMLDAPISGGPARAEAGTLSMMVAGPEAAFARVHGVLDAMADQVFRLGERAGDGSRMKIVNNMMAGANLAAACEAMAFALKLGLEARTTFDVVNASSGGSWIFTDRMARVLAQDPAPRAALKILTKDVGLFVEAARAQEYEAPLARATLAAFRKAVEQGWGDEDDGALIKSYLSPYNAP